MSGIQSTFQVRKLLLPVFLPSVLFAIGESSLIPILPAAAMKLGADLPTAGLVAGLVMLGTLVFDVPAASLVNRFGERRAMLAASILATLSLAALPFAANLFLLGVGVFIAGSTAAVFGLARHGYMAEHVPFSHRARALGLLGGTFRAGAFIGPLLGSVVVLFGGINGVYLMGAAVCLASVIALLLVKDDTMSSPSLKASQNVFVVSKREAKKLATVGVASAILAFARSARTVGLPLWGVFLGMHESQISLYIGIAGFLDFGLFFVSGQIMDRFGRRAAAVPTLTAMGITLGALAFITSPSSFLFVGILMSIANAVGSGIVLTIGADLAPNDARNEFLSAYRLLSDIGIAAAPIAVAALTAASGLSLAFLVVSGISFLGAGMYYRWLPKFGIR